MRSPRLALTGVLAAAIAVALGAPAPVTGQSKSSVPRTPDGHPDLTGMYDLAMLTPLERPAGLPAVLSDQEAAKLERDIAEQERKAGCRFAAIARHLPRAATDRPAPRGTSAGTTRSGWIAVRLQHRRWREARVDCRGSAGWARAADDSGSATACVEPGSAGWRGRHRMRRKATIQDSNRLALTTIRNAVRWASAAAWVRVHLGSAGAAEVLL